MILTRCPNCGTVFRVTPEQLRVRHGQVRCGSCFATFNALAELTEEPLPPGTVPEPGEILQPPAAPFTTGLEEAPTVSDVPPEAVETPATEAEAAREEAETTGEEAETTGEEEEAAGEEAEAAREEAGTTGDEAEFIDIGIPSAAEEPEIDFEVVEVASPAEPEIEDAGPAAEPPAEPLPETAAPPAESGPDRPDDIPAAGRPADAAFMVEPDPRLHPLETAPEPRHWLWWSAAFIALAVLAFQAVVHWRTDLAIRYPESRPALEAICAQLGCEIPLPTRINLLEIEHSDLVPDEKNAGRLQLSATLRNLAAHAQAWPSLELTLTDAHDRPLVRRVLAPRDYLPSADVIAAGFPARGEQQVQLELRAAGVPAVGYRLYLFFP